MSQLALHTRNVDADARASVLIDGSDAEGNPLAGGRVTLIGRLERTASATAARRFLARHPSAAGYASFADFSYFTLRVERAHFIGGFGRIAPLPASDILVDVDGAEALIAAEPELINALNRDTAIKLSRLGERASAGRPGQWQVIAVDPSGIEMALDGDVRRLDFPSLIRDPDDVPRVLASMLA